MIGSLVSNPKKIVIKGVGFYYIGNKNLGVFRTGGASSKNSNSIPAEEGSADFIPKKVHKRGYKKNDAYFGGTEPKTSKRYPYGCASIRDWRGHNEGENQVWAKPCPLVPTLSGKRQIP